MTSERELGKILKQQRVGAQLTLHQLSVMSGVSASHLARVERGDRFPSAHILQKIAPPLGFSESDLFAMAGYLSPQSSAGVETATAVRVDPYVARVLSQEPVEMQRNVIAILSILKSLALHSEGSTGRIEFREYARSNYPELDEDLVTMIEDLLKRPPGR